jgi:uncharacterized membrane protein SpoIIM required for sporulation
VTLARFESERSPQWDELERLIRDAGGKPERLGASGVRRLGTLYRGVAADVAEARRRFPGDPVVGRLESLATRARPLVYSSPGRRGSLREFLVTGYWRRLLERPRLIALAVVALFGPAVLAFLWARSDPGAAIGLVPEQFRHAGDGASHAIGSGGEQAAFSSAIFTNNIRVTFLAFSGGILLGLGTIVVLAYNGVLLGAVAGLAVGAGNGDLLARLVLPHGVLELSCIVVSGVAGLRMGWALIEPGTLTRGAALGAEARRAVELVLGTAPWLVLAGLVEGFVTPRRLPLGAAIAVGVGLGVVYWTLALWRGLKPRAPLRAEVGPDARGGQGVGRRLDHVGAGVA